MVTNTKYSEPEADLPDRYSILAPVETPTRADTAWWQHFNDPTLTYLVDSVVQSNLTLAQSQARLREAAANLEAAGQYISGDGNTEIATSSNGGRRVDGALSAEFNLAGEATQRRQAATARLEAAGLNTLEVRRAIVSEISLAYADLRFFQATRAGRQQDLALRQRTVDDISKQLEVGEATRLDLLRAQSLLAETKSEIPQLDLNIIQQRNRIATLLGVPAGALGTDLSYKGQQPLPSNGASAGVPADLLRARPDIRQSERLYAAAISDMNAANAARYPSLRLSGVISTPLNGGAVTESLLGGLIFPVFSQPALEAEVDAAQARAEQAYLQWRIQVLEAMEEVENAQVLWTTSQRAAQAAREAVTLDRNSLALSREMIIGSGNITVLDVLDRQRSLSASQTALARNLRDVASGYISLQTALGKGHPIDPAQ